MHVHRWIIIHVLCCVYVKCILETLQKRKCVTSGEVCRLQTFTWLVKLDFTGCDLTTVRLSHILLVCKMQTLSIPFKGFRLLYIIIQVTLNILFWIKQDLVVQKVQLNNNSIFLYNNPACTSSKSISILVAVFHEPGRGRPYCYQ